MNFFSDQVEDELSFDINVIPLIDVLLVLLIFFMVSASFVASGGLDVKLPTSSTQSKNRSEETLRVVVTREGQFEFNGKPVNGEELTSLLKEKTAPDQVVVVQADEKVEHHFVVSAMDAIRAAGLDKVAIATTLKQ